MMKLGKQGHKMKMKQTLQVAAMLLLSAIVALAAGRHGSAHAQQVSHHHSHAQAAVAEPGMGAAIDSNGRIWAVGKETGADGQAYLQLRVSADMGKAWSSQRLHDEPVAARGEERPKIAFGPNGQIYVAYTKPVSRPHIGDIRFMRSMDGGKTFSAPLTVHANRDPIVHAFASMIVDTQGHIYVAWIDSRDKLRAKSESRVYAGSAVYYAVSTDGGATFSGDYKIADHSCECCRLALALMPNGRPVAMWRHVFAPNLRDHALAELAPDGQAGMLSRVTFDDWAVDACPHHGPSLAYDEEGSRHQVWFDGKEGGARYQRIDALGRVGAVRKLGSDLSAHADVAAAGTAVAVAWRQFDGQVTSVWQRFSGDGGRSWSERKMATTAGDADKPYLIAGQKGILLLWHTRNEGLQVMKVGD
jgi:hypothetical protein